VTVAKIATRFGFTELGRFSVEYREMFGESPSTTLHQPLRKKTDLRRSFRNVDF